MNPVLKHLILLQMGVISVFACSCAPLLVLTSGGDCKKIRLQDEDGNPVVSASPVFGHVVSPAIMNSSDKNGHMVICRNYPDPKSEMTTIIAAGFQDYSMEFDKVPKVVTLKRRAP